MSRTRKQSSKYDQNVSDSVLNDTRSTSASTSRRSRSREKVISKNGQMCTNVEFDKVIQTIELISSELREVKDELNRRNIQEGRQVNEPLAPGGGGPQEGVGGRAM